MKLNISYPKNGTQKCIDVDDEKKYRNFFEKKLGQEVDADFLGDEFKGYVFKIAGGNDKQGFPMKIGVMTNTRVRLLMGANTSCYRPRRSGERRRKSIRGCIVGSDISALHLIIVKKGAAELPDLTDKNIPRRLGPKRASKLRKLFALSKEDDVRKYVVRRELPAKEGKKKKTKAPKIQRLVTPRRLQHRRQLRAEVKHRAETNKADRAAYVQLLAQRNKEAKDKRAATISQKRSQRVSEKKEAVVETKKEVKKETKPEQKKEQPKKEATKKPEAKPQQQTKKEQSKKEQTKKPTKQ